MLCINTTERFIVYFTLLFICQSSNHDGCILLWIFEFHVFVTCFFIWECEQKTVFTCTLHIDNKFTSVSWKSQSNKDINKNSQYVLPKKQRSKQQFTKNKVMNKNHWSFDQLLIWGFWFLYRFFLFLFFLEWTGLPECLLNCFFF